MATADIATRLKQAERRKSDRATWEGRWEEIATYLAPEQRGFTGPISPGQSLLERVYEGDPMGAADELVAAFYVSLTPSSAEWFRYQTPVDSVNADDAAAEYLEHATHVTHLNLNQSNWKAQITPVYRDALLFGTGVLLIETRLPKGPEFPGFKFTAVPLQQVCLAEDGDGQIRLADRWFTLTARQAIERWPQGTFSDALQKAAETEPDKPFRFLHLVYPRPGGQRGAVALRKPFASCILEIDKKSQVWESGFDSFPYAVWRWQLSTDGVYGRGPGWRALPDVKSLNDAKRMHLEALAKTLNPPTWLEADSVVGTVRSGSGGLNWLKPGTTFQPQPWVSGMRVDANLLVLSEMRETIRKILHAAIFTLPDTLPGREGAPRTATEWVIRREKAEETLAPPVGMAEAELLSPATDRLFQLQYDWGLFGEPPDSLGNQEVSARFEGPLSRVQRLPDVEAIERWEASLLAEAQVTGDPSVLDIRNAEKARRLKARIWGVPAEVINSEDEVADLAAARQRGREQAQETEEALTTAQMVKDVTPAMKALGPGGMPQGAVAMGAGA